MQVRQGGTKGVRMHVDVRATQARDAYPQAGDDWGVRRAQDPPCRVAPAFLAEESLARMRRAASLLLAVHRTNQEFSALDEDGQMVLRADHFIDVLRQFAVHYRVRTWG